MSGFQRENVTAGEIVPKKLKFVSDGTDVGLMTLSYKSCGLGSGVKMSRFFLLLTIALLFLSAQLSLLAEANPAQEPQFSITVTLPPSPTATALPVLDTSNASDIQLLFSTVDSWPTSLVWYPDSEILAAINSQDLMLYDVNTALATAENPRSWADEWGWSEEERLNFSGIAIAISPERGILAVANLLGGMEIFLLDLYNGQLLFTLTGVEIPRRISFSQDGNYLAVGGNNLRVWALPHNNTPELIFQNDDIFVSSIAFGSDNSLVIGNAYGLIILEPDSFAIRYTYTLDALESPIGITEIAIRPNSDEIATISDSSFGNLRIWDIKTGEVIKAISLDAVWAGTLAYSPDGTLLVVSTQSDYYSASSGIVYVLNAENLNILTTLESNVWESSIAFSPDGRLFATASSEQIPHLWGVREQQ